MIIDDLRLDSGGFFRLITRATEDLLAFGGFERNGRSSPACSAGDVGGDPRSIAIKTEFAPARSSISRCLSSSAAFFILERWRAVVAVASRTSA